MGCLAGYMPRYRVIPVNRHLVVPSQVVYKKKKSFTKKTTLGPTT